jgi:hypothetical protein
MESLQRQRWAGKLPFRQALAIRVEVSPFPAPELLDSKGG